MVPSDGVSTILVDLICLRRGVFEGYWEFLVGNVKAVMNIDLVLQLSWSLLQFQGR